MKTAIHPILKRGIGLALLLAICASLSSCIIIEPRHRHYRRPYGGGYYGQEVRP